MSHNIVVLHNNFAGNDQIIVKHVEMQPFSGYIKLLKLCIEFYGVTSRAQNANSYHVTMQRIHSIHTHMVHSELDDVKCFGQEQCFPLAFGVPAVLMIISVSKLHMEKMIACMGF